MSGLSTIGSISFGIALVAGRKRVPNPATGKTALRTGLCIKSSSVASDRAGATMEFKPSREAAVGIFPAGQGIHGKNRGWNQWNIMKSKGYEIMKRSSRETLTTF